MYSEQLSYPYGIIRSACDVSSIQAHDQSTNRSASMSYSITNFPPKNTSGIYAIVNKLNGNQYIGSSENISDRWKRHIKLLQGNKHHSNHLQHAWNAYGAACFDFVVVFLCDKINLLSCEQFYIDTLKPPYNTVPVAGSVTGVIRSEEYRKKQSASQSGKTMSEETRRKISEGMKGKRNSAGIHRVQSQETKDKISATLRGHSVAEETREKLREKNSSYRHTEEAKERISASLIGNKRASRKNG